MASEVSERLGERIRGIRRERGWRQLDLAEHAGLSENYVSDLELGRKEACLDAIASLASALGIDLETLFRGV